MFTSENVISINQWIDKYHGTAQWAPFVAIGIFISLEIFLPQKKYWENNWDKFFTKIKAFLITLTTLVLVSQGFTGGCIIQIPQNWLSQQTLGYDWHPYGLVFREYVPEHYWWILHFFYILLAFLSIWVLKTWFKKRYLLIQYQVN